MTNLGRARISHSTLGARWRQAVRPGAAGAVEGARTEPTNHSSQARHPPLILAAPAAPRDPKRAQVGRSELEASGLGDVKAGRGGKALELAEEGGAGGAGFGIRPGPGSGVRLGDSADKPVERRGGRL